MKTVYLKNHVATVRAECISRNEDGHSYSPELIDQAIAAQIKNRLRYRNGRTFDRSGWISEYVYKTDVPQYTDLNECARWELSGHVRNSASRIFRGFTAI